MEEQTGPKEILGAFRMDPEVAAMQSLDRCGKNPQEIPEEILDRIMQEAKGMIDQGLNLDPNTGDPGHRNEMDKNTRFIIRNI